MAGLRKLPERDQLRTLVLSGQAPADLARTYGVSIAAVTEMLTKEGLDHLVRPRNHAVFIPWRRRKTAHDNDYLIRSLRLYVRSLGLGAPLTNPELEQKAAEGTLTASEAVTLRALSDLRGQLDRFRAEMDAAKAVVTYDYETGFDVVPAQPGDRHYVRWPAGVPDQRDEVLARADARVSS